jgi:hypothetical protein
MTMRKTALALVGAMALGVGTMMTTGAAQAVPAGLSGQLNAGIVGFDLVEKAQYVYRGRRYCFYFDGWHGPGWYWCGYAHRRGYGWGGTTGWRGWHHSNRIYRAPVHRAPSRVYRHNAPGHNQYQGHRRGGEQHNRQPKREY